MTLNVPHGVKDGDTELLFENLWSILQKFSLLGSTGSIGTQTLDIVREHKTKFEIVAIAAGRNIELLAGNNGLG